MTVVHSSKRRRIDQFFKARHESHAVTRTTNPKPPCGARTTANQVPGLELHLDFITQDEQAMLLKLLNDPGRCHWRTDLSRRTMHFGGSYCLMPPRPDISKPNTAAPAIIQAPPFPDELLWLIERFVDRRIVDDKQRPQFCIVNEYVGSQGISAHTENFQFGEPVVGLSLLCACPIRFHELVQPYDGSVRSGKAAKAERTGRRVDVQMPARSVLVMRGKSRWQWQHEIVRNEKGRGEDWKRISLTFRYKKL